VERALTESPMATNLRVNRILCAVTFSPSSRRSVAWAAALARPYDGELRLFHAVPPGDEGGAAAVQDHSERLLGKLFALGDGLPGRPRISAAVTEGDTAAEILRHARLAHADLIAIGMHGRDGRVSPLVAHIAVDAPCPVLAVDETVTPPGRSSAVGRLLVGVDFLPASLAAADYAFALADAVGAQVTVLHVLPEHWDGPRWDDANADDARRLVEHHFREVLRMAVSEIASSTRFKDQIVTSGRPCVEIVRLARVRDTDLIVMGIDAGHTSRELFGETTNCVMQFARRTVLLVPERLFRSLT
jgi:nucleotide-binding universal stress UspA family protein